ncbi:hypothetical protein HK096_000935, partial [Nowakowskiella sp. JEL0078]
SFNQYTNPNREMLLAFKTSKAGKRELFCFPSSRIDVNPISNADKRFQGRASNDVNKFGVSNSGHVACADSLGNVCVWDINGGQPTTIATENQGITETIFRSDSQQNLPKWLNTDFQNEYELITTLSMSPRNEHILLTGHVSGKIRQWDLRYVRTMQSETPNFEFELHHHPKKLKKPVTKIEFSPFNSTIFASAGENMVRIWDRKTMMMDKPLETRSLMTHVLHGNSVTDLSWHPSEWHQ